MAPLSERDEKWVEAIVDAAVTRVLGKAKDFVADRIEAHTRTCPHFMRSKGILVGMVLASSLAGGGGAVVLVKAIAGWVGG